MDKEQLAGMQMGRREEGQSKWIFGIRKRKYNTKQYDFI
jgi:hypothetical protein